jgi:ribose-phosphate pyrophosphokinase
VLGVSDPVLLAGPASAVLGEAVAGKLGVTLCRRVVGRFPDGELHVEIEESVRGRDVYVIQATCAPVEENLFALFLLSDAVRRAGAERVTAVVPYLAYARQDRRARGREPVAARLAADLFPAAGLHRLVALDLHSASLEGVFSIPLEHLSATALLAEAVRPRVAPNSVVVAPDLGAAKLADRFARLLELPVAMVHKTRLSGSDVAARTITGDVRGRAPILVDDMITTAGTVEAAVNAVLEAGGTPEVTLLATHGLFADPAGERLRKLPIRRVYVTDSVTPRPLPKTPVEIVSVAGLLASAIQRLHAKSSLAELIVHD